MSFAIVTDSSSNLTEEVIDRFDLSVLPLTFMVDGEEYRSYLKGAKTDLAQFYAMMREGKVITTSLPNLQESRETIEALLKAGDDVLYLGFSSGLSGTYQAIELLLSELAGLYPERTVTSVDTLAASGGEGLLVTYAAKMREGGASLAEVRDWVEDQKLHLAHWFTVDDLMFLFRGGRVSRTAAWAAPCSTSSRSCTWMTRGTSFPWRRCAAARSPSRPSWTTWSRPPTRPWPTRPSTSPTATAWRTPSTWPAWCASASA